MSESRCTRVDELKIQKELVHDLQQETDVLRREKRETQNTLLETQAALESMQRQRQADVAAQAGQTADEVAQLRHELQRAVEAQEQVSSERQAALAEVGLLKEQLSQSLERSSACAADADARGTEDDAAAQKCEQQRRLDEQRCAARVQSNWAAFEK